MIRSKQTHMKMAQELLKRRLGAQVLTWVLAAFVGLSVNFDAHADEAKPRVGKKAATDYFRKRPKKKRNRSQSSQRRPTSSSEPHFLALHFGTYLDDTSYRWGNKKEDDVAKLNMGVTYRVGEWKNSMDLLFRGEVINYSVADQSATKLSLMPIIAFPDASSKFPLYFGAGAGLGIFLKQLEDESSLSFDYTVLVGGRFFDVFDQLGLLFETGIKNHIFLLSDGQLNGVFLSAGVVFDF